MYAGRPGAAKARLRTSWREIFNDLTSYERSNLAELLEPRHYDANATIITQGEEGKKLYLLESGCAAAFIDGDAGERRVANYTEQGQYFGEIALLCEGLMRQAAAQRAGRSLHVTDIAL